MARTLARSRPAIVPVSGWAAALVTLVALAMSFLAVLTLAAGLAAERLASEWRGTLDGEATVQVSAPPDRVDQVIERALAILRTTDGIARARLLSEAEHEALLAPWLGDALSLGELPAPRLIAVRLTGGGPDGTRLQERLDTAAPGAVYDDHDAWRRPLIAAADRLGWLAWAGAGLIVLAAAATVALAVRATLAGAEEIIRVVRLIGGEDRYVAGAFVRRLGLRGLGGGLAGAGLAGLLLQTVPEAEPGTGAALALLPDPAVWAALVAGVALATALTAWAAAALSVRLTLRGMA
jgi:cell division transport system permease protein